MYMYMYIYIYIYMYIYKFIYIYIYLTNFIQPENHEGHENWLDRCQNCRRDHRRVDTAQLDS